MSNKVQIKTTKYYDEFIRYYDLALKQQERSNLGMVDHADSRNERSANGTDSAI